jgi:hypothetical protein
MQRHKVGNLCKAPLSWIGVNLDIDDAKLAVDAVRKREKKFRDVIDTIPATVGSASTRSSCTTLRLSRITRLEMKRNSNQRHNL